MRQDQSRATLAALTATAVHGRAALAAGADPIVLDYACLDCEHTAGMSAVHTLSS